MNFRKKRYVSYHELKEIIKKTLRRLERAEAVFSRSGDEKTFVSSTHDHNNIHAEGPDDLDPHAVTVVVEQSKKDRKEFVQRARDDIRILAVHVKSLLQPLEAYLGEFQLLALALGLACINHEYQYDHQININNHDSTTKSIPTSESLFLFENWISENMQAALECAVSGPCSRGPTKRPPNYHDEYPQISRPVYTEEEIRKNEEGGPQSQSRSRTPNIAVATVIVDLVRTHAKVLSSASNVYI